MKSTKKLFLQLISLAMGAFFAFSMSFTSTAFAADPVKGKTMVAKRVAPVQTNTNESNESGQVIADAMWIAGGEKYQDAVVILARDYKAKMDKQCRVKSFDVGMAAKNYRFVPFVNEVVRDKMILKQVATMGCEMSPYIHKEDKAAAIQKIWKM